MQGPQRMLVQPLGRELQSLWATTTESTCCKYWSPYAYSLCSATKEATIVRSLCMETKSSTCSQQLEKAYAEQGRLSTTESK